MERRRKPFTVRDLIKVKNWYDLNFDCMARAVKNHRFDLHMKFIVIERRLNSLDIKMRQQLGMDYRSYVNFMRCRYGFSDKADR